jgi:hypothetical protein
LARPITFAAREVSTIFPLPGEAIAMEARSFACQHARLGGIDFGYDHPFDELIYLPAAE